MRFTPTAACVPAFLLGMFLSSCDSPKPAAKTEAEAPPAPVKNDTLLLPSTGQVSASVVPNHILGDPKLPGGTLGEYSAKGKKYQLFIVRAESNQKAAFLLLDLKNAMPDAAYVPHMGGYAGTYQGGPLFVFAKLQYLAGVVGLPQKDADGIARQLAARLQ